MSTRTLFVNCSFEDAAADTVNCNGTDYKIETPHLSYTDTWFWIYLGVYAALVIFAGIMSGLTLGLLSLDELTLNVLCEAGTAAQKKHAKRILPLVKRHHLLLVTLLLANAAAVESMPLCLDRISDPVTAILVSVTAVLLFGEVFPQALCSRFGLAIGAVLSPVVYILMVLLFVVAFPLAKLLDCLLGRGHATFFRRAELKALVGLHGPEGLESSQNDINPPLSYDEVLIIKGAIELRDKVVKDAMVPLESVFMLDVTARMDKPTVAKLLRVAHSRIPIYEDHRGCIRGMLLVKCLIALDPAQGTPITTLMEDPRCFRPVSFAADTMPLYDLLNEFQKGKSHLAIVRTCPNVPATTIIDNKRDGSVQSMDESDGEVVGMITLEDVLEELLQEEIVDETDVYVDVHQRIRVARARANAIRLISREGGGLFSRSGSQSTLFRSVSKSQGSTRGSTRGGPTVPGAPDLLTVPHSAETTPLLDEQD